MSWWPWSAYNNSPKRREERQARLQGAAEVDAILDEIEPKLEGR